MANVLQLSSVNRNVTNNKIDHHTSDYRGSELIVRRGQRFVLTLKLNRAMRSTDSIKFVVEIGKTPTARNKIKTTFPLSNSEANKESWSAVADSMTSKMMNVSITPPVNAIIGTYRLFVQLFSEGYRSHVIGDFFLLFNPWAPDDDVFLNSDSEREEYVLSDSTILYQGSEDRISEQGWNLGQYEDGILQICLKILEKQTTVDLALLYDPKEVSRVCSAMVNSNDDKGVLLGNWSGNYSGGVSPLRWIGSIEILRKWSTSGPVGYGQCWVFAGVLCTVLRCLGIPTRIVTNFASAHDTDETLSIDYFYDPKGRSLGGDDSIWNFHVWNEAWFTRSDIGSYYDGWQVLDATPQETSAGIYQLGPTSVTAVREGDVQLQYDSPFVFSEVNADVISWIYDGEDGSYEKVQTNTRSVGKYTSTKAVGSNKRSDITSNYKYKEGTAEEREVYHNAVFQMFGRRSIGSGEPDAGSMPTDEPDTGKMPTPSAMVRTVKLKSAVTTKNIRGEFKYPDHAVVGEDVILILVLQNTQASQKITITFNVNCTGYTRRVMRSALQDTMSINMDPNQVKEITFKIPYSKYKDSLTDDKVLAVTALCRGEDKQKFLATKVITLLSPSMTIKVLNKAVLNEQTNVEITIVNPLDETLDDCELHVEGSGLIKKHLKRTISLKPTGKTTLRVEMTPYMKGTKQLQVVLTSSKIMNVKGYIIINVQEA